MRKSTDIKLFILYVVIAFGSLVVVIKCNAQTVQDYSYDFMNDAALWGVNLTMHAPEIVEVDQRLYLLVDNTKSYVDAYSDGYKYIYFDIYSTTYQYNLKVLVYHEFGHWYLGRGETSARSIMNTGIWSTSWDSLTPQDQTYFIKELFNNK